MQPCRHTKSLQRWYDVVRYHTASYDIIRSRIGVETTSYQRWNDVACSRGRRMCSSKVHWWQDVSYPLLHDFSFHGTPWDYINEVVEKVGILSSLASTKLDHFQESSTLQTPNFFGWGTTSYDFYLNCSKNLIFTWNLFKKMVYFEIRKKKSHLKKRKTWIRNQNFAKVN